MNNEIFAISLILFLFLDSDLCYECDFFNNLTVKITTVDTFWADYRRVDGCFEPEVFDWESVAGIVAFDQDSIKFIGDHAVHDLLLLNHVKFLNCRNIEEISPNAFENLPKLEVIDISDTKITSIPAGSFENLPSLEFLDLSNNNISDISRDAFGNQPSLEYVILTRNNIKTIDHLWFRHCPNLYYISFNRNKIEVISEDTFQFMPNLKQLFLDFNEIRFIEETSFHHLKDLQTLSLFHNKLVDLNPNIIKENFTVQNFDIKANYLSFLSKDLLEKLSVGVLEISGNPWECACLDEISEWAVQENVTLKNYCTIENVPQCFNGTDPSVCSQETDSNNTKLFIKKSNDLKFPIDDDCANLP